MSHAYRSSDGVPRFLVETWFNPPATQALAMPGWFDHHFDNMQRYRHMACSGRAGRDHLAGPREGRASTRPRSSTRPRPTIAEAIVEGLQVAGRIWFEAGAERVMPATFAWQEYRTPQSLAELPTRILESGDLLMTSAHPQGGNALGAVVDEDFRVAASTTSTSATPACSPPACT